MATPQTRPIVEGALLAACTALLGLLAFYSGLGWIQPIPVLLAYLRNGGRNACLVALLGCLLLALWVGPFGAVAAVAFTAATGLVPGRVIRQGYGAVVAVSVMTAALLVVGAMGFAASLLIWHINPWLHAWRALGQFLQARRHLLRAATGLSPRRARQRVVLLFPATLVLGAAAQATATYALAEGVLRRLGAPMPRLPAPARWRLPRWLAFPFAALAAGAWLLPPVAVRLVVANLLILVAGLYGVVGAAAGWRALRGAGLRGGALALTLAAGLVVLAVTGLGALLPGLGLVSSLMAGASANPRCRGGRTAMKVILVKRVPGLGEAGAVVDVAPGHAQHLLLPRHLAVEATAANLAQRDAARLQQARQAEGEKARAQEQGATLNGAVVIIRSKAGSNGRLFGSVTSQDVADALQAQFGVSVDRRRIDLGEPLKTLGEHDATIHLHPTVTAHVKLRVETV